MFKLFPISRTIRAIISTIHLAFVTVGSSAVANPVILNIDSSGDGLATEAQVPLGSGFYEVGWLNPGVTQAQIVAAFNSGDLAAIDAVFNTVFSFSFTPTSIETAIPGESIGFIFSTTTLVPAGDAAGLAAYKDPITGAAGKRVFGWIRDAQVGASRMAFFDMGLNFNTANDNVGFTDFNTDVTTTVGLTFGPDSVWVGSVATVITGSEVDTNGGTPVDGLNYAGTDKVLLLADLPSANATFAFSAGTATVAENGGSVTITVNRSGAINSAVSVEYATANASAIAGTDYTATTGTLNFAANETSKPVQVPIIDRPNFQGSRSFGINLSNPLPSGSAALGSPATIAVEITDDETPPGGSLAFAQPSFSLGEDGGTATITVNRTNGTAGTISLQYATSDGTATANADYTPTTGTLSWADGEGGGKSFTISVSEDLLDEADETVTITLSNPTGGVGLPSPSSATLTIQDNDSAGTFSLADATAAVTEGAGTLALTINRTSGTNGAIAIIVNTVAGSAIAGTDYTAIVNQAINFADGETAKTVEVAILNNSVFSGARTFSVQLSLPTPSNGALLGTNPETTVTINDDEVPPTTVVNFIPPTGQSVNAIEGSFYELKVKREGGDLTQPLTIEYITTDLTAKVSRDFTPKRGTITFAANSSEEIITFNILQDDKTEGDESFRVTLRKPTATSTYQFGALRKINVKIRRNATADDPISDQPDNLVAAESSAQFTGDDVYTSAAANQVAYQSVKSGGRAKFILRVENDGNVRDGYNVQAVGAGTATGATIVYTRNGKDITEAITSAAGLDLPSLPPGGRTDIAVEIRFKGGRQFTGYGITFKTTSKGTVSKIDSAHVVAIIR